MRPSFMILRPKIGGKGVRLKRGVAGRSGNAMTKLRHRKESVRHRACRQEGKMIEMRMFARIPWKSARLNVSGGRWKRGGIVPFHCRSPSVFLIYAGHVEHAALLKIGLSCPGGRQ